MFFFGWSAFTIKHFFFFLFWGHLMRFIKKSDFEYYMCPKKKKVVKKKYPKWSIKYLSHMTETINLKYRGLFCFRFFFFFYRHVYINKGFGTKGRITLFYKWIGILQTNDLYKKKKPHLFKSQNRKKKTALIFWKNQAKSI